LTGGGGKNDSTAFTKEFTNIDDSIQALIISADPFFQDNKVTLINAVNGWLKAGQSVCYPFADYVGVPGTTAVPPGASAFWFGPKLSDAYTLLGQVAVQALQTQAPVPFSFTTDTSGP
jgi:hypothetical protein